MAYSAVVYSAAVDRIYSNPRALVDVHRAPSASNILGDIRAMRNPGIVTKTTRREIPSVNAGFGGPASVEIMKQIDAQTPPWPEGCYRPDECRASGFCEYDRCPHGAALMIPVQKENIVGRTTEEWGWNGDMCAVWGVAIVLGDSREEKERRARIIANAITVTEGSPDAE